MVESRKRKVKKRAPRKNSVRRTKKLVDKRQTKRRSRRHRRTKRKKVARKKQRGGTCRRGDAGMDRLQCVSDCETNALYKELESANHKLAWEAYKLKSYSPRSSHQLCADVCDLLECGRGATGDTSEAWRIREERGDKQGKILAQEDKTKVLKLATADSTDEKERDQLTKQMKKVEETRLKEHLAQQKKYNVFDIKHGFDSGKPSLAATVKNERAMERRRKDDLKKHLAQQKAMDKFNKIPTGKGNRLLFWKR